MVHTRGPRAWRRWAAPVVALAVAACNGNGPTQLPAGTQLAFTVHPSTATAGAPISPSVQVAIQDASGNTVTTATTSVTVSIGTNPAVGTLSGTRVANPVNGVATFANLSINRVGTGYTLSASATGLTGATSSAFDITVGAAAQLAFTVQPSSATAGAPIAPAVQVTVQDAAGNTVTTATTSITVATDTNPASAIATVSAVNGVATFASLSINRAAASYQLTASATGLTRATSGTFNITAGAATQLGFTVHPSTATAGEAISPAVQVAIQDAFGNTVTTATNSVTAAMGNNPGGGTLSGTTTAGAVNGVATFSNLSIDVAATGYTLGASATGLSATTSTAFDITLPLAFATVAAGGSSRGSHTCGVTTDGAVYCWGYNGNGQLGDNSGTDQHAPVLVHTPAGVTFQAVSAGGQHTCAVASAGDAYCWGRNQFGRLGDGTITDRTTPVRVAAPAGVTFASVSTGADHSCGLAAAGGVAYCWGSNFYGQLGDNSGTDQHSPAVVQAPAGVTFTAVTTGFYHSCGLATSGDVYCWGDNTFGQLGDNTTVGKHTPVQAMAPAGVTFARLEAGYIHTCAVTAAGAAYCWGDNRAGQLGDNTTGSKVVPTAVPGSLQFAIVSGGAFNTCGVTTTGLGYCWGDGALGQLGDNTLVGKLTPTAIAGGLTLSIAATGLSHSCAVATGTNAGVYCWGFNGSGQLGDGTITQRLVPTRVRHQ